MWLKHVTYYKPQFIVLIFLLVTFSIMYSLPILVAFVLLSFYLNIMQLLLLSSFKVHATICSYYIDIYQHVFFLYMYTFFWGQQVDFVNFTLFRKPRWRINNNNNKIISFCSLYKTNIFILQNWLKRAILQCVDNEHTVSGFVLWCHQFVLPGLSVMFQRILFWLSKAIKP